MGENCPNCGEPAQKVAVNDFGSEREEVYVCTNDDGFVLPNCDIAQFTAIFDDMGKQIEVDARRY